MERIEELKHKKKADTRFSLNVKYYEKMEHIPVRDHLYINYDKEFVKNLFQKGKQTKPYFLINFPFRKNHLLLLGKYPHILLASFSEKEEAHCYIRTNI